MRRSVRYTAGLIIAAGASLAFAGPAAAAPQSPPPFPNWIFSAPSQDLTQWNSNSQTVQHNLGNTQTGLLGGNVNYGGNAAAVNSTNQNGYQFAGGIYHW